MIRRTFFQLLSSLLLPPPAPMVGAPPAPALPGMKLPPAPPASALSGMMLPPAVLKPDPEWLKEWRRIPRLEVGADDLPYHNDPHQQALAAEILPRIQTGIPFTFCYLGGSSPGEVRQVLPVQLFRLDYVNRYPHLVDDPGEFPGLGASPLFLVAWCQSRDAPRTFRLDRILPLKAEIAFILDRSDST